MIPWYINVQNWITLLILSFMTWKCAQIDQHPSNYFGTNYQSLKICLKFWDFQGENDKVFVISEKKVTEKSTPPDDWQDDVRSSLYTHFWCFYTRTSSLVVKSLGMTLMTWVQFLGGSIFWNLKFSIPMTFSHVQGYIYHHLDWNNHNHRGLVALYQSIELIVKGSIPVKPECLRGPGGGYHGLQVDGCSLKRPRPWWGVRSGWL
jgi:hypothetical protein